MCQKKEDIERGGSEVSEGSVKKRAYLIIKVTTNVTSILYAKEEWKEEDGTELLIFEQLDDQEQLSIATDMRFDR